MFGRKDKDEKDVLEKVQRAVQATQVPDVRDLSVRQNGTVLEIHGHANSLSAKQRAFQQITEQVGDASGVINFIQIATEQNQQSRPAGIQFPAAGQSDTAGSGAERSHKVAKGETLSHISQHYYGKASEYMKIFNANKDQLNDPDKIREGMTLRIPA